jgi:DNA-binding NarL/FixJ family response regulator
VLSITPSERAALQLLADGKARHEIAARLRVSEKRVDADLRALFIKTGVSNPTQAALAIRRGVLVADEEPACAGAGAAR